VRNELLDFGRLVKVLLNGGVGESEVFKLRSYQAGTYLVE
jgi:hypothetical protein